MKFGIYVVCHGAQHFCVLFQHPVKQISVLLGPTAWLTAQVGRTTASVTPPATTSSRQYAAQIMSRTSMNATWKEKVVSQSFALKWSFREIVVSEIFFSGRYPAPWKPLLMRCLVSFSKYLFLALKKSVARALLQFFLQNVYPNVYFFQEIYLLHFFLFLLWKNYFDFLFRCLFIAHSMTLSFYMNVKYFCNDEFVM